MTECGICCDTLNKRDRKPIDCPYCEYVVCMQCCQRFMDDLKEEPQCMSCRKIWGREVFVDKFPKKYVDTTLKLHMEKILFDRERALLPQTQPATEAYLQKSKLEKKLLKLYNRAEKIRATEEYAMYQSGDVEKGMIHKVAKMWGKYSMIQAKATMYKKIISKETSAQERRQFTMPCPQTHCRGFLSAQYKCGICEVYVCKDCHEVKAGRDDEDHVCDKDKVENAKAIAKETKPCPECGVRIFKVEGCNQMFCTMCHTAFCWATGAKATGVIHNPHYFDYVRQTGNDRPRNPLDQVCGGMPGYSDIHKLGIPFLDQVYRHYQHNQEVVIPLYRPDVQRDNQDIRIKYMLNEIDEDKFKKMVQQRNKAREKKTQLFNVIQTLQTATLDIVQRIAKAAEPPLRTRGRITAPTLSREVKDMVEELKTLRTFINDRLKRVCDTYGCGVMMVNEEFQLIQQIKSNKEFRGVGNTRNHRVDPDYD